MRPTRARPPPRARRRVVAERIAALAMIEARDDRPRAVTLGTDEGYDAEDFVNELRSMHVRPHVAQNTIGRRSLSTGVRLPTVASASANSSASNDYLDLVEPAHIVFESENDGHSSSEPSRDGSTFVTGTRRPPLPAAGGSF